MRLTSETLKCILYVATPSDWMREFERRVKPDARPLVMLRSLIRC